MKPLDEEDKSWLLSNSSRELAELEKMWKDFQSNYPTGIILRPYNILLTDLYNIFAFQSICPTPSTGNDESTFL